MNESRSHAVNRYGWVAVVAAMLIVLALSMWSERAAAVLSTSVLVVGFVTFAVATVIKSR